MSEFFDAALSEATDAETIAAELIEKLGPAPASVVLFFSPDRPGLEVVSRLRREWPSTPVFGCSTAGEISTGVAARTSSVSAAALRSGLVRRSAAAVADYSAGIPEGIRAMADTLEAEFGPLRALDPKRHVGLLYIDSTHGIEELTHNELGNLAPQLQFIGGSAGDNIAFAETTVFADGESTHYGCALAILEVDRPFSGREELPFQAHRRLSHRDQGGWSNSL